MHTLEDSGQATIAPDDATVVARVLAGDTQQFEQLVTRYQRALYRHAVSMVFDPDAAADMVQDTFVRAYTNLASCREHAHFRSWLFQTLRNRCLDYLKQARRKNVRLDDAGPIADGGEGPGDSVERRRLRQEIVRALATLPGAQREAFLMHYVEGISYETMATLLGASVSALKMRVLRAREALVSALQGDKVTQAVPIRLSSRGEARNAR
jgi:RNA polymerase sigma-70 factor (ECF subfamily)